MQGAKKALIKHGYAKLTTNRIAAAAGVSVGSLYQYFPDKNAILIRMIREYADGMQERMQATILANLSSDPEQIVAVVIDSMVDAFAAEKDLMAVIVGEVPYHGGLAELDAIHGKIVDNLTMFIGLIGGQQVKNPRLKAYVAFKGVDGVLLGWLSGRSGFTAAEIKEELTLLATNYLQTIAP